MRAVPALLTNKETEFIQQFVAFLPYFKRFSIDVIDGKFADNLTLQIPQLTEMIVQKKLQIPPDVIFDFDLMVNDYETVIKQIQHLQQFVRVENIFVYFKPLDKKPLPVISNINIGLSLTPNESIEDIDRHYSLKSLLTLQLMTIYPGFQGSPFIKEELRKIEQIRLHGYRNKIFIDGGVNDTTIPLFLHLKLMPDYLCMGSFLTRATDLPSRIKYLHNILGSSYNEK